MFAAAFQKAVQFTRPVVISHRVESGRCSCSIGSFVIVNADGWIVTAAHIVKLLRGLSDAKKAAVDYHTKCDEINAAKGLTKKDRKRALAALGKPTPNDLVTHYSAWWADDNAQIVDVWADEQVDLAIARLSPFNAALVPGFPEFKDPAKAMIPGKSLCKLGYPFHEIVPSFDGARFQLPPEQMPPPLFPMEGMYTRNVIVRQEITPYPKLLLETSSPGLRGQSGGPTFDANGVIWALQVQTSHLSLGFDPEVPGSRNHERVHQFLHVGWGVHPATLVGALRHRGVSFSLAGY